MSEDYILKKIENCKTLIEGDPDNLEYQKYLDLWADAGRNIKIKRVCIICKRTLLEKNYMDHFIKCEAKRLETERKSKELEASRIAESKRLYEEKLAKEAKLKEKEELKRRLAELESVTYTYTNTDINDNNETE